MRFDKNGRFEERLEHVLTERGLLYSWWARPAHPQWCVVICSSLLADFSANYHRERLLARAMAEQGLGAVRFHYWGEGNSQGPRQQVTFTTLCDDTRAVIDHASSLGFTRFALLGTRLGGLVAAAIASSDSSIPLALWEPLLDPLQFIRDAQRARRISRMTGDGGEATSDWHDELEEKGVLDLLGHDVYAPLLESLESVGLLDVIGLTPRPVLVARFGRPGTTPDPLTDALRQRGFSVQTEYVGVAESWFLHSELVAESRDLIGITRSWLLNVTSVMQ